ncbi:MAG: PLP-dependent aminotransferase family protein [Acidimicrobiales bacterium]
MRTSSGEVLIELDRSRPRGLRAQIEDELRDAIRVGRLTPGTGLPSTRALASDLGVTRGVVVAAYDQLLAEGYLLSRPGSGTVVNAAAATPTSDKPAPTDEARIAVDFRPGVPDLSLFPRAAWLRASRAAFQTLPDEDLGYIDPRGLPQLRRAIVEYLGRVRGVTADAEHVVICNGFAHGLSVVIRALVDAGHESMAVEDPGHDGVCGELGWLGVRRHFVPVDNDGIVAERLGRTSARAVMLTPAHQFPTGAVLAPARRCSIVEWARSVDGYVIEDDYDAEYRYDRDPIGAMQGLAPDRVIYSGTLSKSLAPGLRLGWLVLPPALVQPIATGRQHTDHATASHAQATFLTFLTNGDLDRHLRRTRRIYRHRRDTLIAALARWLPDATPSGIAAGLHVLVTLPDRLDEADVAARARAAGVGIYPLSGYCTGDRDRATPAIVLGYGNLTPAAIEQGVRTLAHAVATAR